MPDKRAKIISEEQIGEVIDYIREYSDDPTADELKFVLSTRAGMRACEISGLTIDAVTNPEGKIDRFIEIFSHTSKNGNPARSQCTPKLPRQFGRSGPTTQMRHGLLLARGAGRRT